MIDKYFLLEVKDYIEHQEVLVCSEWGACETLEELIANDQMPTLYDEALMRLKKHEVEDSIGKGDVSL